MVLIDINEQALTDVKTELEGLVSGAADKDTGVIAT